MSGTNMDLETITIETIELTKNLNFQFKKFDDEFGDIHSRLTSDSVESTTIRDLSSARNQEYFGAGVVFLLEKGVSTFCIRGIASDDLSWEHGLLMAQKSDFLKYFRLTKEDQSEIEEIRFFPTPTVEIAEGIIKTMMNRRFPIKEVSLCNLSDPGFSWWMDLSESEINIFFQSPTIDRDKMFIQLGPLGDSTKAIEMLQKASSTLKHFFPIKEYSVTSRSISISCCENGLEGFLEFSRLFEEGEFFWEEVLKLGKGQHFEVLDYLYHLSCRRQFWRLISEL